MDQENAGVRKRKRKEEAGARKRKRGGGGGGGGVGGGEPQQQDKAVAVAAVVGKVAECVQQEDEEDYEGITEESVAEMMSWLALELAAPSGDGVTTAGTSASVAPPPAGYVTVQGNMESCGPSFSRSASTVMASVDVQFVAPVPPVVPWPWPEAAPGPEVEETADEEWVAGLLTDGPTEEGWYSGQ